MLAGTSSTTREARPTRTCRPFSLTGSTTLPRSLFGNTPPAGLSVAMARASGLCCVAIVKVTHAALRPAVHSLTAFYRCACLLSSTLLFASVLWARQTEPAKPVVVQPGAPGKPSKTLPPSTTGMLPPLSQADVAFMHGMIMHHAQAVAMTALIVSHTDNQELRLLGARISRSQSDEIKFMKRWLAARGEAVTMAGSSTASASGTTSSGAGHSQEAGATPGLDRSNMSQGAMGLMPGMLSPEQMEALRKAKGAEFDHLFLTGMIQHHHGALTMVKDLFDTAGAGQDAELFNFATDVDTGQRAEIRIMQGMLEKKASEERR